MPKLLIFDAFTLLIREKNVAIYALLRCKMSQFTHFCGVKFLASKSGTWEFWTNFMSDSWRTIKNCVKAISRPYQLATHNSLLIASPRMWIIVIVCVCCFPSPINGGFSKMILPVKQCFL